MSFSDIPILKLYIDPEHKGLIETYQNAIEKHNQKITNDFPDSGFDLFLPEVVKFTSNNTLMVNMHIKGALYLKDKPLPYYIYPRSSMGSKTPLRLANSVGIIDCGYRGNLGCIFDCLHKDYEASQFQRLTQICAGDLSFFKVELVNSEEKLGLTERGEGGFGSTGK